MKGKKYTIDSLKKAKVKLKTETFILPGGIYFFLRDKKQQWLYTALPAWGSSLPVTGIIIALCQDIINTVCSDPLGLSVGQNVICL